MITHASRSDKQNVKINLVATPGIRLRWGDGNGVFGLRTIEPRITQHLVKAMLEKGLRNDFPTIRPEIDIINMKMMDPAREEKYGEVGYGDRTIQKYRLGAPFNSVTEQIKCSDILGLSCNFTQEALIVTDFTEFAKRTDSNAFIIVGGSDATARPEYFLKHGADAVVLGEGEKIGHRLVAAWAGELGLDDVSGIAYMENGNMRINQKLRSDIPQPSDFVFPSSYVPFLNEYNPASGWVTPEWVRKKGRIMTIETSRGCKWSCPICTTPNQRKGYRPMSLEQEIELLEHYKAHGVKTLLEWEDNRLARLDLPNGREDVIATFRKKREMGFLWEFTNGLEIGQFVKKDGSIDKELMQALYYNNFEKMRYGEKPVGCFRAYVPLESVRHDGDEPLYKKLKPWELEKDILREIVRAGVPMLIIGLIIGIPSETKETLELTYKRCEEIKQLVKEENEKKVRSGKAKTSVVIPLFLDMLLPGSRDYGTFSDRIKYGIEEHPELWNFHTSNINGDVFSPEEMTKIRKKMAERLNEGEATKWRGKGSPILL